MYLPNVTNDLQSSHEYADNYLKDAQIHKYSVLVAKIPNACEGKTSISCRYLTRATESCCRQSLTITVINYSGGASELGGIVNLVGRRRPSLSRSERPSCRAKLILHVSTIIYRTVRSPEFRRKFRTKVPLFCKYLNSLRAQRKISRKKPPCQNPARYVRPFRYKTDL